ncbi:MAG: heat-inducible transcription repressor HrcA [Clostridia bacterium]|nr:heat-inducible transcription repressor HrcA [Clostridia bacterium]
MSEKKLTPRKVQILKAIVDAHIDHGEPVGSKYLSQAAAISASPATIRNEMAELEEMGYLIQPHTSAGRVPSELGYRLYVDALIKQYSETKSEIDEINDRLRYKLTEMDEILSEASRLAASFTDYTGIAFKSGAGKVRVLRFNSILLSEFDFLLVMTFAKDVVKSKKIHLSFPIDEDTLRRFTEALNIYLVNLTGDEIAMPIIVKLEAIMGSSGEMVHPTIKVIYEAMAELDSADVKLDGIAKLLKYPEYSDVTKLRSLLGVLEEKNKLMEVIESHAERDDGIHVYIGTENDSDVMQGTTMIYKSINIGGSQVAIGVIGPKRMNYQHVIDMISKLASGIERIGEEERRSSHPRLLNSYDDEI